MNDNDDVLIHYGTPRHSGRYPWGSGKNPQRNRNFLAVSSELRSKGVSENDIAKAMGMTITQYRAQKSIARSQKHAQDVAFAQKLKEKGMSTSAIARRMGINESTLRGMLNPSVQARSNRIQSTSDILKKEISEKNYIDVGKGTEVRMGISSQMLKNAVSNLKDEGYSYINLPTTQRGTGYKTNIVVLAKPGTTWKEVKQNQDKIGIVNYKFDSDSNNFTKLGIKEPKSISSDRVAVRYGDEGGTAKDGLIELRRGVDGLDLGDARYAQVRIAVDGTHYLKGMAVYSDDIPKGYDILFNTNKHSGTPKTDPDKDAPQVFKAMKSDKDNPFGASLKIDSNDAGDMIPVQRGYINVVREEGDWDKWSRNLASQMLSKQPVSLAKKQLGIASDERKAELKEIESLTNPTVKAKLLISFADECDYDAVHLKAAAMDRQASKVLIPVTSLKSTEIYAPTYKDGEHVILIRYPHGGKFEIPALTVNNNNKESKNLVGNAKDAVCINHDVAAVLSGADFDGDTVLVIPNNNKLFKTESAIKELEDYDPQAAYPAYEGMPKVSKDTGFHRQREMGEITNLITDMTLKGGYSESDITRAVKHSMVVIDAEKHNLNWRQSAIDNNIAELKTKYQGGPRSGASTLISKSKSELSVPKRSLRYSINPETGEKIYYPTGETYINKKTGKTVERVTRSSKMAEAKDAYSLSSGTVMESVYADHANLLKAMANSARKESISCKDISKSPSAAKVYSSEVASLNSKLLLAKKNAPLERKAQLMAGSIVSQKRQADPDMDKAEVKKIGAQALAAARAKLGSKKAVINITDKEWEAIQAGAISPTKLADILNNADIEQVKQLAMPREEKTISASTKSKILTYLSNGYTQAQIADLLGVSTSTINRVKNE